MKISRAKLLRIIQEEYSRLSSSITEGEELDFEEPADEGGEEEGDDPFGGGDEGGDDAGGEAEEGGDEEAAPEDEEEKPPIEPGDEIALGKTLDDNVQAMMLDFESAALKSTDVNAEEIDLSVEWWKRPLTDLLSEGEDDAGVDPSLDVEVFASEVARLFKNYDSLLDIESFIINKAKSFLQDKYGEDTMQHFEEILELRHNISLNPANGEVTDHVAVGATSAGAA